LVDDGNIRTLSSNLRLLTHNDNSDVTVVPTYSALPHRLDHVQHDKGSSDNPIQVIEKQVGSSFPKRLSFEVHVM